MPILVCGSLAVDHLQTFPGRFSDAILAEKLSSLSVSFLVDGLEERRGGVGGNIAFGMGVLGAEPWLVGALGADGATYREWLHSHGVQCDHVLMSREQHTARFTCTTDTAQAQIATFYPGAMSEASRTDLAPILTQLAPTYVHIGADDPEAMRRHTQACREAKVRFIADPSQQLSSMPAEDVDYVLQGAHAVFCNEYEFDLLLRHTGWTSAQFVEAFSLVVRTNGESGVTVWEQGAQHQLAAVPARTVADPTGVGDAFRAGFLTARELGVPPRVAAMAGAGLATLVVETVGTQEYEHGVSTLPDRVHEAYGEEASALQPLWRQLREHTSASQAASTSC